MITLEINNKDYKLPTEFSEIKLNQYVNIAELDSELTEGERMCAIISIATGIDYEEVKRINIEQIKYISNSLSFLFKQTDHKLIDQIKIKDKWYGLNKDIANVTFGEYIDLENFSKPEDKHKNLHILMALLYRPQKQKRKLSKLPNFVEKYIYDRGEVYDIVEYDENSVHERAELFKTEMSIDIVLGAMFFFIVLRTIIIKSSVNYLKKSEKKKMLLKMMNEMNLHFHPVGDG